MRDFLRAKREAIRREILTAISSPVTLRCFLSSSSSLSSNPPYPDAYGALKSSFYSSGKLTRSCFSINSSASCNLRSVISLQNTHQCIIQLISLPQNLLLHPTLSFQNSMRHLPYVVYHIFTHSLTLSSLFYVVSYVCTDIASLFQDD